MTDNEERQSVSEQLAQSKAYPKIGENDITEADEKKAQESPKEPLSEKWSKKEIILAILIFLSVPTLAVLGLGAPSWWIPGYDYPNENTTPGIVRPGDVVRLKIDKIDTTAGLWNVKSHSINANPIKTLKGEDLTWQPKTFTTHHDKWSELINVPKDKWGNVKYESSEVWIELTLPAREELSGNTLEVRVNLEIEKPMAWVERDKFSRGQSGMVVFKNFTFNLDKNVSFKVATAEQKTTYERWSIVRTISYVIGFAALIVILLFFILVISG